MWPHLVLTVEAALVTDKPLKLQAVGGEGLEGQCPSLGGIILLHVSPNGVRIGRFTVCADGNIFPHWIIWLSRAIRCPLSEVTLVWSSFFFENLYSRSFVLLYLFLMKCFSLQIEMVYVGLGTLTHLPMYRKKTEAISHYKRRVKWYRFLRSREMSGVHSKQEL